MDAWLPGNALYTPFRLPVAMAGRDIKLFRRWMIERATEGMKAAPSEWRWALEGDDIVVVAAKAS
jgi:hypothetical protein